MTAEPVGLADQIVELRRECAMRERVYGDWVVAGRMTAQESVTRIRRMTAALSSLVTLADGGTPRGSSNGTIAEQIAEVKREMALRQRVYPRWVEQGRMPSAQADAQLAAMAAALATLEAVANAHRAEQPELGL